MLLRFCGLRRLPSRPTIVNWLKQFTARAAQGPIGVERCIGPRANRAIGSEPSDGRYGRHRGSGRQSGWMGVSRIQSSSPRRIKVTTLCSLTWLRPGQILKSRNRPGNVHDSRGCRCVSTGTDRRATGPVRSVPKAGIPHGRRVFQRKDSQEARALPKRVRDQGSVLAVARPKGGRRWAQAMAPRE